MQVERQIDVKDDILIAVKAEFHIAKLTVPRVDFREKCRTLLCVLKIGNIVEFDLDKAIGMIELAHDDDSRDRLVVFEFVPHIEICLLAVFLTLIAQFVVPVVLIEFRLDGIANAHRGGFFAAMKSIKESHLSPPYSLFCESLVPIFMVPEQSSRSR